MVTQTDDFDKIEVDSVGEDPGGVLDEGMTIDDFKPEDKPGEKAPSADDDGLSLDIEQPAAQKEDTLSLDDPKPAEAQPAAEDKPKPKPEAQMPVRKHVAIKKGIQNRLRRAQARTDELQTEVDTLRAKDSPMDQYLRENPDAEAVPLTVTRAEDQHQRKLDDLTSQQRDVKSEISPMLDQQEDRVADIDADDLISDLWHYAKGAMTDGDLAALRDTFHSFEKSEDAISYVRQRLVDIIKTKGGDYAKQMAGTAITAWKKSQGIKPKVPAKPSPTPTPNATETDEAVGDVMGEEYEDLADYILG